jgi:predicted RNA methylase
MKADTTPMATVKEHYEQVLSDAYSWMFGGYSAGIERNIDFFKMHKIESERSGIAIDLGAGCGFQSIPLAKVGFSVTAVDIDGKLLKELKDNSGSLVIEIIQDDLINFDKYIENKAELIVCMTDTLVHLESRDKVISLLNKVANSLDDAGKFIITFRDLSSELTQLDRFIPVRSDENTIFTCFLEYESETVKVHDIVYRRNQGEWKLNKSFYRKLRLSKSFQMLALTISNQRLRMDWLMLLPSKTDNYYQPG